jgi:predicted DNA binding CopG/RHH family protein
MRAKKPGENAMSEAEKWEDGTLGRDAEHAALVPEASAALDNALELQLISIRLQKQLIDNLKVIANHHGIGYQPMIRDLLNRFVISEAKKIYNEKLAELEKQRQEEPESTPPVEAFMRSAKCA